MRRFIFREKAEEPNTTKEEIVDTVIVNNEAGTETSTITSTDECSATTSTLITEIQDDKKENQDDITKALDEYTEEDWKNFAKTHPNVVRIMTEISNEEMIEPKNDTDLPERAQNDSDQIINRQLSLLMPKNLICNFIDNSGLFISKVYSKIHNKFSPENMKLINEVLTEVLESFAYTQNHEKSVAIAFVLRSLSEAQSLPTIREVPNIGIYITVLTILVEVLKVLMHIGFSNEKQELRNKIAKIFE